MHTLGFIILGFVIGWIVTSWFKDKDRYGGYGQTLGKPND